jgi:hypothetical protein
MAELAPKLPVPVALAYCSDHVLMSTGALPRLKSSMKSFETARPSCRHRRRSG